MTRHFNMPDCPRCVLDLTTYIMWGDTELLIESLTTQARESQEEIAGLKTNIGKLEEERSYYRDRLSTPAPA